MDDVLGDFFSEIESIQTAEKEIPDAGPSSTTTSESPTSSVVSAAPVVIQKAAAVEIKTVKAVPNITYASDTKTSNTESASSNNPSNSSVYEPPTTQQSHHTHTHTAPPSFKAPLPPTPYSSTGTPGLVMTGAQMLAAQQPTVPQPAIVKQDKKFVRSGAGDVWVDDTLNDWPANDFRLFVGDLGNEVSTEMLAKEFQKYKTFAKAKVIRGGWNNKSKGYGFVSFIDPFDCAKALREMNGKYLGNRPMKLRKSTWKDNNINEVRKKEKKKRKIAESLGLA